MINLAVYFLGKKKSAKIFRHCGQWSSLKDGTDHDSAAHGEVTEKDADGKDTKIAEKDAEGKHTLAPALTYDCHSDQHQFLWSDLGPFVLDKPSNLVTGKAAAVRRMIIILIIILIIL
jgi:hypothetical protein